MLTLVRRGSELLVRLLTPPAAASRVKHWGASGLAKTTDLPSPILSARASEVALRVSEAALHEQLTDERQRHEALEESDKEMTDLRNLGSVTRSRTIPELD